MDLSNTVKAKVFSPKACEYRKSTIGAFISTYEGKREDGTKLYSSWNTYFVGKAYEKAKQLKEGDWIVILQGKVENSFNKEKDKLYVNVTVFDFNIDVLEAKE